MISTPCQTSQWCVWVRITVSDHTHLLTWPFSWCRKQTNWVWPSRLTKGKLMKTLWKADWFFSPSLHYIHCPLQYSRRERRQAAAAEPELITHLFNRLAEMRTEHQRMPENTPCALFKWLGLKERIVTLEYELAGLTRNLETAHFGLWQKQMKKLFVSSSTLL